ncbi:hypothetical protein [Ralstonia pseudosolanacearum]|uniref:hypothetical protein n=1 Tax=Ralstonia pseudosolanacearum TaxID=1310165 RepID=UPI003CEBD0BA
MYKFPTKKQAAAFKKQVLEVFERLGVKLVDNGAMYPYAVETVAGTLQMAVQDDWIACRFNDVALAKKHVYSGPLARLNPFSGKWNWDGAMTCLEQFERETQMLLPVTVES